MSKTILLTGATDGIGLEAAKLLAKSGHRVLLHGRSKDKLASASAAVAAVANDTDVKTYCADLSTVEATESLAQEVIASNDRLDVLINNAGVLKTPETVTSEGLDIRFAVNTIAPYLLTKALLPLLGDQARVVNLSSAAQASVDLAALANATGLDDMEAYSQSKLAITMWTNGVASSLQDRSIMLVSVNPGSLLGSKMVSDAFGVQGKSLSIGAEILSRAALSPEFEQASGLYFDNDAGDFGPPHADALNITQCMAVVEAIEQTIARVKNARVKNAGS